MPSAPWSSLEIAKLVIAAATPLLIFGLGVWLQRTLKRLDHLQWSNQKLVERRLQAYDEMAPSLNDLLCYFRFIGNWKDSTPRQMVDTKRKLDKQMHLAAPLFSGRLLGRYHAFINLCFKTFNEMGTDAQLRTTAEPRRRHSRDPWDPQWDQLFAPSADITAPPAITEAYDRLIAAMTEEIGVGLNAPSGATGSRAPVDTSGVRA